MSHEKIVFLLCLLVTHSDFHQEQKLNDTISTGASPAAAGRAATGPPSPAARGAIPTVDEAEEMLMENPLNLAAGDGDGLGGRAFYHGLTSHLRELRSTKDSASLKVSE